MKNARTEKFKGYGSHIIRVFIPNVRFFSKIISERLLPAFDEALGDIENTEDETEHVGIEMMRQSMTNLYAVGLMHLYEQQISYLVMRVSNENQRYADYQKDKRYLDSSEIDIEKFRSWKKIEELRWAGNTVKHAEGVSSKNLKEVRPDLLVYPPIADILMHDFFKNRTVHHPLSGHDVYLQESDIQDYAQAIEDFWNEFIGELESYIKH